MKKTLITISAATMALIPTLGEVSSVYASTDSNVKQNLVSSEDTAEQKQSEMIKNVKPYVHLNDDGTIELKDVPQETYDRYNLSSLEKHFQTINKGVHNGTLTVDNNLNVEEVTPAFTTMAVYGKWTYHWWGYDRKFNDYQTEQYIDRLNTQAAGAGMVTGVGAWFPPVGGLAAVSGGYWYLLATRVDANNHGNGVLVQVTWANIFDVEPL
ncbi:hypothetical protein [Halobacillus kuroshimensis]|uniref:hypothetical protein n=1 Tax=Halobacillus kuroshimensis TaxID=302481 RepID=UPI0006883741|nr:hypothetical protein [Halobacillus kuroshimensis]